VSAPVRECPLKREALADRTPAGASSCALSAMAYVNVPTIGMLLRFAFRKPLLYPSELRGHERGGLCAIAASCARCPDTLETRAAMAGRAEEPTRQ
jgi:hypothetical protein